VRLKAKIRSYFVRQDAISINLICSGITDSIIQELKELRENKGNAQDIKIEDLNLSAAIESISIRDSIHILLHSQRDRHVVNKLLEFMDCESVTVIMNSENEKKLSYLLSLASSNMNKPADEVLYQLTTFKGRDGKLVDGKRSIYDISKKSQEVVINKLTRIIGQSKASVNQPQPRQ
jgi:hypothetical protein